MLRNGPRYWLRHAPRDARLARQELFERRFLRACAPRNDDERDQQHACVAAGDEGPNDPPGRNHDSLVIELEASSLMPRYYAKLVPQRNRDDKAMFYMIKN